ncbi:Rhs family protein [Lysobacter dokdonensis DS-58]|uniref:Rhs family protein n=1 Tax=Lysobacter dokdonensis DS-58 TaxID=1300345 RepID=A0A0A2WD94_9GAMM|nr:RHS repeat-associated core domain-containing protein [Lysobacter dokdonensis]KGQ18161.1 Rhs family protein [Lysobacter dokdonensis DS-58]
MAAEKESTMKRLHIAAALALATAQVNAQTYSRTDEITYEDNAAVWVIGQQKQSKNVDTQLIESRTLFDAGTALPVQTFAFEKLQQTFAYDALGNLAAISDGRDTPTFNTTIKFEEWKRGIPQKITFADGNYRSALVDDLGLIKYVEDELRNRTCYTFDPVGRLAGITYPSDTAQTCDTSRWNPLVRSFQPSGTAEAGLPIGHWVEQVATDKGVQVTRFDALWRPVVTDRYDDTSAASKLATRSMSVTRYAPQGGVAFQSYPSALVSNYATVTAGTRTTYDALGRPTRVEQDTELGLAITQHEYLSNFQYRVTSPKTTQTTTSYYTYDEPSTDLPSGIFSPEGVVTSIVRDRFGKPEAITRGNASGTIAVARSFTYATDQSLCRTAEPETGVTLMDYDDAGNLAWSAAGLPEGTPCGGSTVVGGIERKSTRTYDNRNRLTVLEFGDDVGEQVWNYTADGLPNGVWNYNGAGRTQGVYRAYAYNTRRMIAGTGETVYQPGQYTWSLGYGYNANGFQVTQVNPDTSGLTFAVNALGQTTGITGTSGTYVSNATYYPNGALDQFTYGNGIVHKLLQNARGMPDRSKDSYGTTAFLDDSYTYDYNGNVAGISDGRSGARGNRTMTYDGLDRLTSVTSPMFNGTINYTYDVLDNIQALSAPANGSMAERKWRYCYEAATNRLQFLREITSNCSSGTTAYNALTFDVQGNLTSKGGQGYTFSQDNRLREVNGKETYLYDAHGLRVQATSMPGTGKILSLYSKAGQIAFQRDERALTNNAYVYLAGSFVMTREQPLSGGPPTLKFHHTDALGTPMVVTGLARNIIEQSEYEPYGRVANRAMHGGPGFTGHVEDSLTGMTYMQQRYYDSDVVAFLSVDPMAVDTATAWNFNRYNYAAGNPYKFKDPDGRVIDTVWDVASVVYDLGKVGYGVYKGDRELVKEGLIDAGFDAAAILIPFVPAGASKAVRAGDKAMDAVRATTDFKDFNQARNAAIGWLGDKGFKAEKATLGKFGENKGKPVGMTTADGKSGFRVEYDGRHGAHINVWSGKEKQTFTFKGTPEQVNKLVRQFIKEHQ